MLQDHLKNLLQFIFHLDDILQKKPQVNIQRLSFIAQPKLTAELQASQSSKAVGG